ncbi:MAG TPA: Kiwa anti-phage protein KwaB-like domain-containing protein [Candidatus Saccharimonadales bacterium]|nr:Kiwa anti-phage protein KwaB-like domain-containing protein [Candidatus Saccharimonadales bacterium]
MEQTSITPSATTETTENAAPVEREQTDIFNWANNLFMYKDNLKIELFLLSKNNVLYRTQHKPEVGKQLIPLLLDNILEFVMTGAGEGLVVRGFEEAEEEDNVLQRTQLDNIEKMVEAMRWLGGQEHEMEMFNEDDHDLRRMRGLIARCSHPEMEKSFYVIKSLSAANVVKGIGGWTIGAQTFEALDPGAALRIPADNQILLLEQDVYVFNQSKLERLFNYNAKKNAIAEKKVDEINANFTLSFADELDLQTMVKASKTLINKLQKIDPQSVKQEDLLNHAEELGVELMTDDSGAIIIMDVKDLNKFVNLLNDDYVESSMTGRRYEIKSKKILEPESDEK